MPNRKRRDELAALVPETVDLREFQAALEKPVIKRLLNTTGGSQAEAARRLGLSRSDLSYNLAKHSIKSPMS